MADPAVVASLVGAAALAPQITVLGLRHLDAQRWSSGLRSYRVEIPSGCEPSSVETFLASLTGLLSSKWERPFTVRGIGLEIVATDSGIVHELLVPSHQEDIVLGQLRASLPSARVEADPGYRTFSPTLAGELATARPHRQLRVDHPEVVATAILGSLQPLDREEIACIQLLVLPRSPLAAPPTNESWSDFLSGLTTSAERRKSEPSKEAREKYSHPLFAVALRLAVSTKSPARDRQLLARVTAGFHSANSSDAVLRRRRTAPKQSAHAFLARRPPSLAPSCLLSSPELAGLVALPPPGSSLAGLHLGGSRLLPASSDVPTSGRIVAVSNFAGTARPLALSTVASMQHLHIIGPPGVGKSWLIANLALQDMAGSHGVVVIDPKRDLVEDLLDRIPEHRRADVVVFDPLDDRPIGLNVLRSLDGDPELAAEQVFAVLHRLNKDSWGPRLADLLRAALHTLARTEDATLCELPLLLTDANYRRCVIGGLDDPIGLGAVWAWFDALSDGERSQAISPILNKVRPWIVRPSLRHVLGQSRPLLDLESVLAERQILLVPLSAGELGDEAAALLGAILLTKLFQAVMRRVRLDRSLRNPTFLFIDEAQILGNLPTPLPDLLAMSRAMGVGVTLAHQTLSQFDTVLRDAVMGAVRSRVIFQASSGDASRLAKELAPYLAASDLQGLGKYEVVVTLATGERVAPPATGRTLPLSKGNGAAELVRDLSRQRWGRDRAQVESELRQRHERPTGSGPIGRQRRSA